MDPSTVSLGSPTLGNSGNVLPTDPSAPNYYWSNLGTLSIAAGSTINLGGVFTTATFDGLVAGGQIVASDTLNLTGTLDNRAATLALSSSTGPLNLVGGLIFQGTVTTDALGNDLAATPTLGTLNGVTVEGTLDLSTLYDQVALDAVTLGGGMALPGTISMTGYGTAAFVYNGLTLDNGLIELGGALNTGNSGQLLFGKYQDGISQTLAGTGTIRFGQNSGQDDLANVSSGTLIIAPGITIQGGLSSVIESYYGTASGPIDNQGAIKEDTAGGSLTINADNWVNDGSIEVSNGATATLEGQGWSNGLNNNAATITATDSTLNLFSSWTNYGTITVDPSTVSLGSPTLGNSGNVLPTDPSAPNYYWSNLGTLLIAAGSTINLGGVFTTATFDGLVAGGQIVASDMLNLTGTLDNRAATLALSSSTGPLNLVGGLIFQGTVTTDALGNDLAATQTLGTLNGVTVEGTLDLSTLYDQVALDAVTLGGGMALPGTISMTGYGTSAFIYSGLTFDNGLIDLGGAANTSNYGQLYFGAYQDGISQTVAGTGTIQFGQDSTHSDAIYNRTNGTLIFGPGITIRSGLYGNIATYYGSPTSGPIEFEGAFTIGQGSTINSTGDLETAGTTTIDGTLDVANLEIIGGTLEGIGTINGNVQNGATVEPGDAPGTLTINGNYTQDSVGILNIDLGGYPSPFGQLAISGTASLDGTLNVNLVSGYSPVFGNNFTILTFTSHTGTFATVNGLSNAGGPLFKLYYNTGNVMLDAATSTIFVSQKWTLVSPPTGGSEDGATVSSTEFGGTIDAIYGETGFGIITGYSAVRIRHADHPGRH